MIILLLTEEAVEYDPMSDVNIVPLKIWLLHNDKLCKVNPLQPEFQKWYGECNTTTYVTQLFCFPKGRHEQVVTMYKVQV